ncbi:MAG: hypothetical protein ABII07_04650 [Patescibacteria group bacterium]|nr:hypothetical protein [Patescibacteria group bacterium]
MKLEKLLKTAQTYEASALLISTGAHPALRINGELTLIKDHPIVTEEMAKEYFSENTFRLSEGIRFKANIYRTKNGQTGVFQQISTEIPPLPQELKKFTTTKNGIILISRDFTSSFIEEINQTETKHIVIAGDPIDHTLENKKSIIDQVETYSQTPCDIIALEDPEAAIQASKSGKLVLIPLQADNIQDTIDEFRGQDLAKELKAAIKIQNVQTFQATEILINNPEIADLIHQETPLNTESLLEKYRKQGMKSMKRALLEMASEGKISKEDAMRLIENY